MLKSSGGSRPKDLEAPAGLSQVANISVGSLQLLSLQLSPQGAVSGFCAWCLCDEAQPDHFPCLQLAPQEESTGLGKVTLAELTALGWDLLGMGQLASGRLGDRTAAFSPLCVFFLLSSAWQEPSVGP